MRLCAWRVPPGLSGLAHPYVLRHGAGGAPGGAVQGRQMIVPLLGGV